MPGEGHWMAGCAVGSRPLGMPGEGHWLAGCAVGCCRPLGMPGEGPWIDGWLAGWQTGRPLGVPHRKIQNLFFFFVLFSCRLLE